MLFLTFLLFVADTVLKPQMKNKKTVSRPAEKDFKATNVSVHDVIFNYLTVATLRWLKAVSSNFQDIDFDVSSLPLVITWY